MKKVVKQAFYFTYGFGQLYANCYTKIEATSYEEAREKMMAETNMWAFQYKSAEDAGIKRWNLKEIPLSEAHKNKKLT